MKNNNEVLYGAIAIEGGWTVTYKAKDNVSGYTQGYGDFPFERFPDIPVIDWRSGKNMDDIIPFILSLKSPREQSSLPSQNDPSLQEYLQTIQDFGITIYNY